MHPAAAFDDPSAPLRVSLHGAGPRALRVRAALERHGLEVAAGGDAAGKSRAHVVVAEIAGDDEACAAAELVAAAHPGAPTLLVPTEDAEPVASGRGYDVVAPLVDVVALFLLAACRPPARAAAASGFADGDASLALAELEEATGLAYFEIDAGTRALRWSSALASIVAVDAPRDAVGLDDFLALVVPDDRVGLERALERALAEGASVAACFRVAAAGGATVELRARGSALGAAGARRVVCVLEDVSTLAGALRDAEARATRDALTGLGNRSFFRERAELALRIARAKGRRMAVVFLDVDRFKRVNDSLGHGAGDVLLRTLAERLHARVRSSDIVLRDPEDTVVSRLGGDEFTILLTDVHDGEATERVVGRVLRAVAAPVSLGDQSLSVTMSAGVAVFPDDGEDIDALLQRADTALYQAKAKGGNAYQFFSPRMEAQVRRRLALENRLHRALEQRQIGVCYQPRVAYPSGRAVAAEALLRWDDEELGAVPPAELVHVAEESGQIVALGRYVLERACREAHRWQAEGRSIERVAVNVSPVQFARDDICEAVFTTLKETGLSPDALELEITETALLRDEVGVSLALEELRSTGVRIALDDFGTGYSALTLLTRVPLDMLKLDRGFLRNADPNTPEARLVTTMVEMAHALRLTPVAEGVESLAQAQMLAATGCREMQGYAFSPPVTASLLRSHYACD